MTNEIKEKLRKRIIELKQNLRYLTSDEKDLLISFTSFLNVNASLSERKYYFMNNINEIRKCPVCGKEVKYEIRRCKPKIFCSKECQNSTIGKLWFSKQQSIKLKTFMNNKTEEYKNEMSIKLKNALNKNINEVRRKQLKSRRTSHYQIFVNKIKENNIEPLFSAEEYAVATKGKSLRFKCSKCGKEFEYLIKRNNVISADKIHCPCAFHKFSSVEENKIHNWLLSMGIKNIEKNKRNWHSEERVEADIFLPDYNLVIEFNGIYWHSSLFKENDYHYNKWKFFKERNIQCIQIFENEWRDNKEVVKNIILDKLNLLQPLNEKNYYLDFVGDNEFNSFLQQNSLFKNKKSDNKLGIYTSNKELIQVLSYSISDDKILIQNFCTKLGIKFAEGLKAFINYLKRTCDKDIYIEIDCRYFDRNDFKGFKFVEHTEPKCFYMAKSCHKLSEEKLSDNKCLKIFSCGNDILKV